MNEYEWLINPFATNKISDLKTEKEEQLIELKFDKLFRLTFTEMNLDNFWLSVKKSYPLIYLKAISVLLPFSSSWFCEFGFSALTEKGKNIPKVAEFTY